MGVLKNDAIDSHRHEFGDMVPEPGKTLIELAHQSSKCIGRHLDFRQPAGEFPAG